MARTVKGRDRFQFRIVLVPPDQQRRTAARPIGSCRWKYRAIYLMKMYLTVQAKKAVSRANCKWYKFYSVRGYGAPSTTEFICPYSGMVAKTIKQSEAVHLRKYWIQCAKKSEEILRWLNELDPERYTARLNHYLRALIILPPNMREYSEYQKANPFQKHKQWREL